MTKKAVLIGLIMAIIVLAVLFIFFRPNNTDDSDDTIYPNTDTSTTDQVGGSANLDTNTTDSSEANDADSLDLELDSLEADINSDNSADFDSTGL